MVRCIHWVILSFISLLLFAGGTSAQQLNIRNYNITEGLAQSQVQVILQDNQGYMWFGTAGGLSRFDGHNFVNFNQNDGLGGNYISAGLKDSLGNLWFGHNNGCITRVHSHSKEFERLCLGNGNDNFSNYHVEELYQDRQGTIWAGTLGQGLFYFDGTNFNQIGSNGALLGSNVYDIVQTDDGRYWVATDNGITIFNENPAKEDAGYDTLTAANGLPDSFVGAILQDSHGNMWISVIGQGVVRLSPDGQQTLYSTKDGMLSNECWDIFESSDGSLWFSLQHGGVSRLIFAEDSGKKSRFFSFSSYNGLKSPNVNCTFEDLEGNMWFGTDGRGVSQLWDFSVEIFGKSEGLTDRAVWTILEDKSGQMWFGYETGIVRFNAAADTERVTFFKEFEGKPLQDVLDGFRDSQSNIWFIPLGIGPIRWNEESGRFEPIRLPDSFPEQHVITMNEDNSGRLWFGSLFWGLLAFDPKTGHYQHFNRKKSGLSCDSINVIYKTRNGNLWFGTESGGVMRYEGQSFQVFSPKTGYPINSAVAISEDNQNRVWFVSRDDALYCFDGREFKDYSAYEGLDGDAIFSVWAKDGDIWVGTTNGIACLKEGDSVFVHYGVAEGYPILETNEKAVYEDGSGNLWFGTVRGAVKFNPAYLKFNPVPPKIEISRLRIFLKDAPFPEDARFAPDKNYLTFHFVGISLSVPERIAYTYKLEGFDKEWSPVTRESYATYSNLPPGKYVFMVKARNNSGVWTTMPAEYAFEILRPFYQTFWFYLFVALGLLLAIYVYINLRIRNIEVGRRRLEQMVEQRTRELLDEKENVEKANKALSESESKFRNYTESTSSTMFIYQNFVIRYVNNAAEKLTGYKRDELIGQSFIDLIHPDFQSIVKDRPVAKMNRKSLPTRYELKIVTKNGEERWLDFTATIIDLDGQAAGLGTAFDITERKKAEEALLDEKERLAVTLRSIADGVIVTNNNHQITLINPVAEKLLHCSRDEVLGKSILDLFRIYDEHNEHPLPNPVKKVIERRGLAADEGSAYLKLDQQSKSLISYSAAALLKKGRQLIGVVLVFRDITEKRNMEQELLKSQKLESVGILAGGIAHDFNNILTAVVGNLSILKMHIPQEGRVVRRLESAAKAAERAQDLTQQLLTFSKGGTPVKSKTAIADLVKESVSFVLSGSNVKCCLELAESLWAVEVDPGQISQVVHNLILNADQSMPNGGKIYISIRNAWITPDESGIPLEEGRYILIRIRDEGTGIKKDHLPKIFDPFFSTKQSGSGLGLATAYSIIKKHHGHLMVESVLGEGSTFSIYLPAIQETIIRQKENPPSIAFHSNEGRVLLMDDEQFIRDTAGDMLTLLGFEVEFAEDGMEALKAYDQARAQGRPFNFVIMDLTIPGGMGGRVAVQKLLEMDPDATVIVASGYSSDPVMSDHEAFGFKGCLRKPFTVNDLNEVLKGLNLVGV